MFRQTATRYELTEHGAPGPFMWFEVPLGTDLDELPDGWRDFVEAAGTNRTFRVERGDDIYMGASVKAFAI